MAKVMVHRNCGGYATMLRLKAAGWKTVERFYGWECRKEAKAAASRYAKREAIDRVRVSA